MQRPVVLVACACGDLRNRKLRGGQQVFDVLEAFGVEVRAKRLAGFATKARGKRDATNPEPVSELADRRETVVLSTPSLILLHL